MAKRGGFPGGMGMPGNMNNLMKQAQRMQKQMEESQKELQEKTYTAAAGGGAVEVTISGKKEVTAVKLAEDDYTDLLSQEQKTSRIPAHKVSADGRYARDEVFVEAVFEVTDSHGEVQVQYESEALLPYKYIKLQKPTIRTQVTEQEKYFEILLQSDVYAPFVNLDFADADVIFSDNFFSITGTEPVEIVIDRADILRGSFADARDLRQRLQIRSLADSY